MVYRMCAAVILLLAVNAVAKVPSINEFTKGMQARTGYVDVYYDPTQDKLFLALKAFDAPFILQTSLPQGVGSNDIGLDRGQLADTRLVQFERYGNKVMLKQLNTQYRASSSNLAEKNSVDEAFADSVIAGFVVVAADGDKVIIDYTDFLLSDVHGVVKRLESTEQGSFKLDPKRSGVYLKNSKAFPLNTELEAMLTFAGTKPGEYLKHVAPDPENITVHMHHSLVALPDDNYQARAFHPYSGFWKFSYFDYSAPIAEPMEQKFIVRHRLNKKDPSAEVSEALEPIIYYLDPGIPEPIMSALRDGALWWNQAFEAIGYKNAFQVKVLPEGADPMDIRYNVINWVHRATRGWSYGMSVRDPRTGEIIKGQVTLGSLRVRQDYLIALGLTSPFVDGNVNTEAQQAMALARIRQLSAHEVGHTLGIAHNFAASENERASVMDYPHPKLELRDGNISLKDAYAVGMGAWDMHAVAYGYQDFVSEATERKGLSQQIASARDRGLRYKSDPDTRAARHASSDGHLWDNGGDPVKEFQELSEIRRFALNNLGLNTIKHGQSLSSIEYTLVPIYLLHRYQLDALAKQVGGIDYSYELKGDSKTHQGVHPVAAEKQRQSIEALLQSASADYLAFPEALIKLIPPNIYGEDPSREEFKGRTGLVFDPVAAAEAAAAYSLALLLTPEKLNRLALQNSNNSDMPAPRNVVKKILEQHYYAADKSRAAVPARLQLVAINAVMQTLADKTLGPEVKAQIEFELKKLHRWLNKNDDDAVYAALEDYFEIYWHKGEWPAMFEAKALPPGSPI